MKKPGTGKLTNDTGVALLFALPSLAGFVIFLLVPILMSFLVSFTNYSGSFKNLRLVGLHNYKMLVLDDKFWQSLYVTFIFVAASVSFQLVLGFLFGERAVKNVAPLLGQFFGRGEFKAG